MHLVDAPSSLLGRGVSHETVPDVDSLDYENSVFLLDFTSHVGREASVAGRDPARLQRASEGPG